MPDKPQPTKSPEQRKRKRTCRSCGHKGYKDEFVAGRMLCLSCHSAQVNLSRSKKSGVSSDGILELEFKLSDPETTVEDAFEDRDQLSDLIKDNLNLAIKDSIQAIEFGKVRLKAATDSKSAKLINDAVKGLEASQTRHVQLLTRLMEKLSLLDSLRAQQEKAKPVTFVLMQPGDTVNIVPMREIPKSYYPEDDQAKDDESP